MNKLRQQNQVIESPEQFENWIRNRINTRKLLQQSQRIQSGPYQIPVVVHIIHNGEAIGTGANISDSQVLSQINVLNKDFNRQNADQGNTPSEFQSMAASLDIEFVLAKSDPEGFATNGIVRVQGTKTTWTINDNYELKSLSYWPAENYFNIWVCKLSDLLGYAQFPVSSLPGHENSSTNRLTDGIVIAYNAFGSIEDDGTFVLNSNYNRGRTATHEAGHFFGLHHIWGEDNNGCADTDYVDDTPNQDNFSSGCPTQPKITCSSDDMFQNYLDYTNDVCMNIFTQGQVDRMITIIEGSPRRLSLLTSPGLNDPVPVANNLGIKSIVSPAPLECSATVAPAIEVKNYGNNVISSAQIVLRRNGATTETKDFPLSLNLLQSQTVSFSPISVSDGEEISFEILQTNGTTDGYAFNNEDSVTVEVQDTGTAPFEENLTTLPSNWSIENPDHYLTWQLVSALNGTGGNKALKMQFYNYEYQGESDIFLSPVLDFSTLTAATLSFDISYAQFPGNDQDELIVRVLTQCEHDLNAGTSVYGKSGTELTTHASTSASYSPAQAGDWRHEVVDLSAYLGEPVIQIAFIGINGYGNNLYLDNIKLDGTALNDVAIGKLISPPAVCTDSSPVEVSILNRGTTILSTFTISYQINGGAEQVVDFSGQNIPVAGSTTISLPEISWNEGLNSMHIEASDPNNEEDLLAADNQKTFSIEKSNDADKIPLRENFDGMSHWTTINSEGGAMWDAAPTNYNTSMRFNAFSYEVAGDEAWLVSPSLDMSITNAASMFYDLSYAVNGTTHEHLKILASTDCENFDITLLDDAALNSTQSTSAWIPGAPSDWQRKFIDLTAVAGQQNVRIAFVVTNAHGNNLYLDNIEFFTDNNSLPPHAKFPFILTVGNPAEHIDFGITFDLPERQSVFIEVLDIMGRTIMTAQQPDILNQSFPVMLNSPAGIYIVRVIVGGAFYSSRVFVAR